MTSIPLEQSSPLIPLLIIVAITLVCIYIVLKRRKQKKLDKTKSSIVQHEVSHIRLYGIVLAIILISSATFVYFSQSSSLPPKGTRAVIIDQVILTIGENPSFIRTVESMLQDNGYAVDYVGGRSVSVEFYRTLPTLGYSIIIIRAHSRPNQICSGQIYSESEYISEQLDGRLTHVLVTSTEDYFAITDRFVDSMRGKFKNTTIIMMGCNGLADDDMAKAFVNKGALVYIGWLQSVLTDRTEQGTQVLLKHLIDRKTVEESVALTMEKVGPYPVLGYYPLSAGTVTIT